jgi:hypothetical protein
LLWRHVTWRAKYIQGVRNAAVGFDQPGKPKIGQMRFAFCIEQNVSRFDVAMQNAVFMRVMHSACHLGDEFHCLPD